MTVFRKYRANGAACQALMKLASVHGADSTNRVEYSGAWNAVHNAYTNGNTHRIPRSHAAAVSSTLMEPRVDCLEAISPRRTVGASTRMELIGSVSGARETGIARALPLRAARAKPSSARPHTRCPRSESRSHRCNRAKGR